MIAAGHQAGRRTPAAPVTVGWLALAATPTFAVMALVSSLPVGDAGMMCSAPRGAPPLGGMVLMYLLMSAFHSAPWLQLISRRRPADR